MESKPKKYIAIQPKERKDKTLPYPYFIYIGGYVGRQDFWKGEPFKLIGFSKSKKQGIVKGSVDFGDFWKNQSLAIGMYPIFEHKDGEWYTYQDKIDCVSSGLKK